MGASSTIAAAGSSIASGTNAPAPLAAALIDHHSRGPSKTWIHHPEMVATAREVTQQTLASVSLDQPSPRPLRKLHHPFKAVPKGGKANQHHGITAGGSTVVYGTGNQPNHASVIGPTGTGTGSTPPESPTLPGRKIK